MSVNPKVVREYLLQLQQQICKTLEDFDEKARFDCRVMEDERSYSRPQVLSLGNFIEKAAVNFTHSRGQSLPAAASKRRPHLAGHPFQAVSLSLIVHPRNPYAPTTHANLRFFISSAPTPTWWFGGGFDLTPFYPFLEDATHWHQQAKNACAPFGDDIYPMFKKQCDEYFYLPHRRECRGVGGLFFDDWSRDGFETSFSLVSSIGNHFLEAYMPILRRRNTMKYGNRQRHHQLHRRSRYVEFNLMYDRGTKYGLQSGRRIESVMASMPPNLSFVYDYTPETHEEQQITDFLQPREWL